MRRDRRVDESSLFFYGVDGISGLFTMFREAKREVSTEILGSLKERKG